jgi:integrase
MTTSSRPTTYDVRVWKIEQVKTKTGASHKVVWLVAGRRWKKSFKTAAAADGFRSEIVSAQRRGEAFDVQSGEPVSKVRARIEAVTWYAFALRYVDQKWPTASGTYRRGIAEALTAATMAMLPAVEDPVEARAVRSALTYWAFNRRPGSAERPADVVRRLAWVADRSPRLQELAQPAVVRRTLDAMALTLAGKAAAATTINRRRAVLSNLLNCAVEERLLETNPLGSIRWRAPKGNHAVDRRSVVSPAQARKLLAAVRRTKRSGPRLVAFFGCLYYSALRPEEAVNLRCANLDLPEEGWGWLLLERSAPDTGKAWTDSGKQRDERQLKHRAVGDTRRVPCPPELVVLLREHLKVFGVDGSGRLFRGERGDELATVTYGRLWDRARARALTAEQYASPLARRPYDLRHAAVSTWLNSGVPATQVAEWAGHSVAVLLDVYAKCIDGQEVTALKRVGEALKG